MKQTPFIILAILATHLTGQTAQDTLAASSTGERLNGLSIAQRTIFSKNDTVPVVVTLADTKRKANALWYLNGRVVDEHLLSTIDPHKIEEIKIEKESAEYETVNYSGAIYIKTKENYTPKSISLNELKAKYLDIQDSILTLFLLDGAAINMDYDQYQVDEKYILKIEVQRVDSIKEELNIAVINLITRTRENLEKANTLRLKGGEFQWNE